MTEQNPDSGPIWVDGETIKSSYSSSGACVGVRRRAGQLSLVDVVDMEVVPGLAVDVTPDMYFDFIAGVKNDAFGTRQ